MALQLGKRPNKNWFWKDDKSGWEAFGEQGGMSLNAALANVAGELSRLSSDYGQIDLPETRIAAFNLRLPPPGTAEINDFLDMGQLTRLQNELMEHQDSVRQLEEKMAGLSVMDTNTSADEQQLFELMQHQGCYPSPRPVITDFTG